MMEKDKQKGICNFYDGVYKNRTWKYYENYLKRFSNNPKSILHVGSGLGLFLECCRQYGIDCLGLEYNRNAVNDCIKKRGPNNDRFTL